MPSVRYSGVCFLCALGIDDEPGPQLVEIVVPFTEEPEQTLTCLAHRECAQRVIHPEYRLPTYEEFVSDEWANYDEPVRGHSLTVAHSNAAPLFVTGRCRASSR
jgi:hypothetical protein